MVRLNASSRGLPPLLAALAAPVALAACDGCHGSKPYTPYTLSDSPSATAASSGDAGSAAAPGPAFSALAGVPAPGDGSTWPLAGGVAQPPAGHAFVTGLVLDVDGDGKDDLLAWSRAPDGLRGEIWFAPGSNPAAGRTVATLPADLAVPGCGAGASLSQIGPRAVALDYEPRCPPRLRDRAVRWIAVLRLPAGAIPELGLELRLGAPAEGESLQVALDGRDRDGDGRGDVAATITLTGAPRPLPGGGAAAVTLAFLDRPAGLSRDPAEPEASFKALTSGLVADGRKKTTAPRIPAAALAARRLHALLCEEGGHPAIVTSAGPVRCGETRVAEDSTMAEIEAALNLGDPVAAVAALGHLDALGPHRKDVDALVAKSVPTLPGRRIRTTLAAPDPKPPPAFGPLAFDAGGDLLVRTRDRVVRVDHASFDETPLDDGGTAAAWPGRLTFPPGAGTASPTWTLTGVEERCDAPALFARFDVGGQAAEVALPVAVSARCAAGPIPVDFLGASAQGALLAVRGEVVVLPMETPPRPALAEALAIVPGAAVDPGAARSPDGSVIALPTSRGVLVAVLKGGGRGAAAKLWTAPGEDKASACVPASGGRRLACVVRQGAGAAIYEER